MRFFPYIIKLLYYKAIHAASYNQFQTNAYNLNIFQNMYSLIWSYIYIYLVWKKLPFLQLHLF